MRAKAQPSTQSSALPYVNALNSSLFARAFNGEDEGVKNGP